MLSPTHTWSLAFIAVIYGITAFWVFRRFSDRAKVEFTKRKVRAYLYAFRLFSNDPALIFRAQRQFFLWNGRYLRQHLLPSAILIVPTAVLFAHLYAVYGLRALKSNESAIIKLKTKNKIDLSSRLPLLEGQGVIVETAPVRVPDRSEIFWRVRIEKPASGRVRLLMNGAVVEKSVQVGESLMYVSERRVRSALDWLRFPAEHRIENGGVSYIEVEYPPAQINVFGFGFSWLTWFFLVSGTTMLLMKK